MKVPRRTALRRVASLVAVMVVATLAVMGVTSTVAMAASAMTSATSYEATTEDGVKVSVGAPRGALPDGATLHVDPVTSDEDVQAVTDELHAAAVSYDGFAAFDVYFTDTEGNEVEPNEAVSVRFELPEGAVPDGAEDLAVHRLAEAEDGTVDDVKAVADDADITDGKIMVEDDNTVSAEFESDGFSVFTVAWGTNFEESTSEKDGSAEEKSETGADDRGQDEKLKSSRSSINTLADGEGATLLEETFTEGTFQWGDWTVVGNSAGLTAANRDSEYGIDQSHDTNTEDYIGPNHGDGYLQLTDASEGQTGTVLYNTPVQSRLGLNISFVQWQFDTTTYNADGIAFYLVDGGADLTQDTMGPMGENVGGALGYAAIRANSRTYEGIEHGVLGVGLDVWGNYSAKEAVGGDGTRDSGDKQGSHQYSVTVRGAGEQDENGNWTRGYAVIDGARVKVDNSYLATNKPSQSNGQNVQGAANGVQVNIVISPLDEEGNQYITVRLKRQNDRNWHIAINNVLLEDQLPELVKFGFTASTGEGTNAHFIRGLEVKTVEQAEPGIMITKTVQGAQDSAAKIYEAGDQVTYQFTVTNTGSATLYNVGVTDNDISEAIQGGKTTLAPQETTVFTVTHTLTRDDVAGGSFTNVATATGYDEAGKQVEDTDDETITTLPSLGEPSHSKRIGYDGNDEYTLALDVIGRSASATATSGKPLDVVMIIDRSTSMNDPMSGADQYVKIDASDVVESSGGFRNGYTGTIAEQYTYGGEYYALNSQGGYDRIEEITQTHEGTARLVGGSYEEHLSWSLNGTTVEPETTDFYEKREGGSTTRLQALKDAANDFVNSAAALENSDQVRIGIVSFAGTSESDQNASSIDTNGMLLNLTEQNVSSLHSIINSYNPGSRQGTYPEQAFEDSASLFRSSQEGTQKVVIFFTDGGPGGGSNWGGSWTINNEVADGAIEAAKQVKDLDVTIFSVGVMDEADVTKGVGGASTSASESDRINAYMHAVSSNYPAATGFTPSEIGEGGNNGYYKATTNASELQEIFEDIFSQTTATAQYRGVTIHDELSQYATAEGFISIEPVSADGFGKVADGAYLTVSRVTLDEGGNITSEQPVATSEEGYPTQGEDYDIWYNPSTDVIELRFAENYALRANWRYTLSFKVKPTQEAYDAYATDSTYGGNTGDTGTDLYTEASHPSSGDFELNTSADKPGFDSNNNAYVSYRDGDETPKAEYLDPVLQVHPLMVEGEAALQVTKTVKGHALESNTFNFTVTPVKPIDNTSSAQESAKFAGFDWNEEDTSHAVPFSNGSHVGGAGETVSIREGNNLLISPAHAGDTDSKTYAYEYREISDASNAEVIFDTNVYRVEVTVAQQNGELTATIKKYLMNGDVPEKIGEDVVLTQANPSPENPISIDFVNEYKDYGLTIYKYGWKDLNNNGKVDGEESAAPRPGAKFVVTPVSPDDGASLGPKETDVDGNAVFEDGLKEGVVYSISETWVPSGYDLAEDQYFMIDDGVAYMMERGNEGVWQKVYVDGEPSTIPTISGNSYMFRIEIGNKETPDLPSSGSNGTLLMMSTGVAVVLLAGAYLSKRFGRHRN